jgi:hypothetical protein
MCGGKLYLRSTNQSEHLKKTIDTIEKLSTSAAIAPKKYNV